MEVDSATKACEVDAAIANHQDYVVQGSSSSYLMKADCLNNNNKFYILQVLKHKQTQQHYLYTRYGRVGDPGIKDLKLMSEELAVKGYAKTLHAKLAPSKGYTVIDMKLGPADTDAEMKTENALIAKSNQPVEKVEVKYAESELEPEVQEFIKLIFNK